LVALGVVGFDGAGAHVNLVDAGLVAPQEQS
jgi:hypothetical protein